MSELTKERLEELRNLLVLNPDDPVDDYLTPADMIDFIDELLALRTPRDAGDEEVNWCREELAKTDEELRLIKDLNENHDIAIARGQTRTDAVNKAAEWAKECEGLQEQLREVRESCPCNCHHQPDSKEAMGLAEHSNCGECIKGLLEEAEAMQDSLCEKYESELREARAEIERLKGIVETCYTQVEQNRKQIAALTAERDEARKECKKLVGVVTERTEYGVNLLGQINELAAIKSCPAMAEVDALKRDCIDLLAKIVLMRGIEEESRPPQPNPVPSYQELRERIDKLADLACRSIASQAEVVGLLKWWVDEKKTRHGFGQHLDAIATNPGESGDKARRILEIVEGK